MLLPRTLAATVLVATLGTGAQAVGADDPMVRPGAFFLNPYAGAHVFVEKQEGFKNSGVVGLRLGVNLSSRFALELGAGYVQTTTTVLLPGQESGDDGKVAHLLNPRLDLDIYFARGRVAPYAQLGVGFKYFSIPHRGEEDNARIEVDANGVLPQPKNPDIDFELDAALGLKLFVVPVFGIDLNARYLMSLQPGEVFESTDGSYSYADRFDNLEFTVGIFAQLGGGPRDRDGDGILDNKDSCPDDPEDKDGFEDLEGCPDPDNDKDGILDGDDSCPMEPEDIDSFQDKDGCPDPDNDKDGILDRDDSCPMDPEDKDAFEDQDGCPDPDNDKDGILDAADKCVNVPETRNGFEDEDGCPDKLPVELERFSGVIQGINFEYDSDVITKGSYSILDGAAGTLLKFKTIRVEIQGHTSQDGTTEHNQDLSQRRAESVMRYLVRAGIEPGRLSAVGYGESKPIYPDTDAERSRNRRVEFHILAGGDATIEVQKAPGKP